MHLRRITFFPEKYPTREFYPFSLQLFNQTGNIEFYSPVTFFVGENGTGKSTLLEAIAHRCDIHIWGGDKGTRVVINRYQEMLYRFIEIEWIDGLVPGSFFGSSTFRNFAQILEEWAASDPEMLDYFGGESLLTQSHGQSLMSYFKNRYRIKGLYFLDEPETALSPRSQLDLLNVIGDMSRAGHAQFIIATHSPILMACPGAKIYSFDHAPIKEIDYEETEHYRVYKDFMEDRGRYFR